MCPVSITQHKPSDRVGYLKEEDKPMNDIDPLIACAASVAALAITLLAAHPELVILVPT
jgi:hypothetical protein